jgi:hypothetical protein
MSSGEQKAKSFNLLAMAIRSCQVSCRDLAGNEHTVEVTAETLYEAVAQALAIMRGDQWVEQIGEGLAEVKVRVKHPAVEHRVRVKDFRKWLETNPRSPAESLLKRRLAEMARGAGRGVMIRPARQLTGKGRIGLGLKASQQGNLGPADVRDVAAQIMGLLSYNTNKWT